MERIEEKLSSPRVDILRTKETTMENKYFIFRPQYLAKDETKWNELMQDNCLNYRLWLCDK